MTEKSTDYILEQLGTLNNRIVTVAGGASRLATVTDETFEAVSKVLYKLTKSNKRLKSFNRTMFIFSAACCAYAYFNEKRLNKIESEMKELKSQKGD